GTAVRPELCRGRAVEVRVRYRAPGGGVTVGCTTGGIAGGRVAPAAEPVHHRLGDVLDDGEPAREVAVERGVADRHLRLVAGGEHQPAELVGQRHQEVAPDARLDVLRGEVLAFGAGDAARAHEPG